MRKVLFYVDLTDLLSEESCTEYSHTIGGEVNKIFFYSMWVQMPAVIEKQILK